MLEILRPGIQTTLQAGLRTGYRHMGVPWAGPADAWSMAVANRLAGNAPDMAALEITLGGVAARFEKDTVFAMTGVPARADLNGNTAPFHETLTAPAGAELVIAVPDAGMRIYLAVAGGFTADEFLGSQSTYLPAGFGGHDGRALQAGDRLPYGPETGEVQQLRTPEHLRPVISHAYALRACPSAETHLLDAASEMALFGTEFTIGRQATRMGVSLEGCKLDLASDGKMKSAAVFPGIIQCPENGTPIILLADAQTTGGYPRIASVARCDRHMLGQLRPGDRVRLLKRTHGQALADLKAKQAFMRAWVPDFDI